eukprot:8004-Heterococcus_DN1.PRE.1
MLVTVITVADYLVGHHLNSKLPFHIPESGVTMFIGMLLGAFISALGELTCCSSYLPLRLRLIALMLPSMSVCSLRQDATASPASIQDCIAVW